MGQDEVALVKNLPGGSDICWERFMKGQRYQLTALANCTALTTLAITANRLYGIPLLVCNNQTFIKIGIYVGTLSAGAVRLGIYANLDGDVYPGALLADCGTVDVGSTGLKEIVISQQLTPGLYWIALVGNSAPTLRAIAVAGAMPILGLDNAFATTPGNAWYVAFTYGVLPNPFTGGGAVNVASVPAVALLKQ